MKTYTNYVPCGVMYHDEVQYIRDNAVNAHITTTTQQNKFSNLSLFLFIIIFQPALRGRITLLKL